MNHSRVILANFNTTVSTVSLKMISKAALRVRKRNPASKKSIRMSLLRQRRELKSEDRRDRREGVSGGEGRMIEGGEGGGGGEGTMTGGGGEG